MSPFSLSHFLTSQCPLSLASTLANPLTCLFMMETDSSNAYHGYLLVTIDPPRCDGGFGFEWNLVKARLSARRWPLFRSTRNRAVIGPGDPVAFYVAGTRKNGGHIVARAVVDRKINWLYGDPTVDPPQYLTELPNTVLYLRDVRFFSEPISIREAIPRLSFIPSNSKRWGVALMGGCRALTYSDWKALLGSNSDI